jgi:hypothetical protein
MLKKGNKHFGTIVFAVFYRSGLGFPFSTHAHAPHKKIPPKQRQFALVPSSVVQ